MDQKKANTKIKPDIIQGEDEFQNLEDFIKRKEAQSKVLKKILKSYSNQNTNKLNH